MNRVIFSQKKKVMMRFDPTQPEHSKFEVKEQITEKKKQKRKNLIVEENEKKAEEFQKPVVSKDTFYQVATDLKTSLENKQQEFSLLSMFNRTQQEEAGKPSCTSFTMLLPYILIFLF